MKAMAAEYEAVIASLKKKDKGGKANAEFSNTRQFHATPIAETTIIHIKYL